MVEDAEDEFGSDDFDGNDIEDPADSPEPDSPELDNPEDNLEDSPNGSIEDDRPDSPELESPVPDSSELDNPEDSPNGSIEDDRPDSPELDSPVPDSPELDNPEDSLEDSPNGSIEDDSGSNSHDALEDLSDNQDQNDDDDDDQNDDDQNDDDQNDDDQNDDDQNDDNDDDQNDDNDDDQNDDDNDDNNDNDDGDSLHELELDVADGISSSSTDIDIEEVFLRAAYDDSPAPDWAPGDARAQAMPQTRRRSVVESSTPTRLPPLQSQTSAASPSASPSRLEPTHAPPARSQASASQRSAFKRRRSDDLQEGPGSSAAAGLTPSRRLPPISTLLETIGGSSSGSQPSRPRPQISPKRLKREEPIIIDDLFGSDDDGVEVVNLIDVDRPKATQAEPEPTPAPEPEPEPAPEAPSASLVKFSGLQCVICMDDMSNLTVTHCGMLPNPVPNPLRLEKYLTRCE